MLVFETKAPVCAIAPTPFPVRSRVSQKRRADESQGEAAPTEAFVGGNGLTGMKGSRDEFGKRRFVFPEGPVRFLCSLLYPNPHGPISEQKGGQPMGEE